MNRQDRINRIAARLLIIQNAINYRTLSTEAGYQIAQQETEALKKELEMLEGKR